MKKIFPVLSFAAAWMLLHACSTDFSTIAPYKETMVVYGLLNPDPNQKTQYIRINKAFLGEGNSLIMAQQKDSINYGDVLDVKLQRIVNGSVTQTYQLNRDVTVPKDEGIFYNPYQVVFKDSNPTDPIVPEGTYKLIVYNKQTGLTATSQTNIIGDFSGTHPTVAGMGLTSQIYTSFQFDHGAVNGWVYNFTIRFHYKEVNLSTNDTTSKYVDWNFGDEVSSSSQITPVVYDHIFRPDIYRIIGSAISPIDTNVIRRVIYEPGTPSQSSPIELIYTVGTEDLYTYLQLTRPSYGLVQDRPVFTNIENGTGLFTSRATKSYFKNLDAPSRAAFDTSRYTKNIHFIHQ